MDLIESFYNVRMLRCFFLLPLAAFFARAETCTIRVNTVGAVHAGMTVRQAREVLAGTQFKQSEDIDKIAIFIVTRGATRLMDLYPYQEDGVKESSKIELVRVYDPACVTAEGVHAGMPLAEVQKRFGKLKRLTLNDGLPREIAEFEKVPSWLEIDAGDGSAGIYPKGMHCADRFKPSATVFSLWVSHPITEKFPEDPNFCGTPEK
jgi:hypothetical protein